MARSMGPLCQASWLMVSLAVIICAKSVSTSDTECSSSEIKRIEYIPIADRNKKDWKDLAEAYIKVLTDQPTNSLGGVLKIRNKCKPEEVVRMLDDLKVSVGNFDLESTNLRVPQSWQNLWSLRDIKFDCGKDYIGTILTRLKTCKSNQWQFNYVLDCFRAYLDKCGHESNYRKMLENLQSKHWDSDKFSSLDIYLRREVWPKSPSTSELMGIFSVFKEISELQSNYDEASCKNDDRRNNWADFIQKSKAEEYPKMYKLVKDYFMVYLDKCGYEKRFREVLTKHEVGIDEGKSPLTSYLLGYLKKSNQFYIYDADEIVTALKMLNNLHELDQDEFNCNSETTNRIFTLQSGAKKSKCTKFVKPVDDIVAKYLEVCKNDFKRRAKQLFSGSSELRAEQREAWEFIKKFAEEVETMIKRKHSGDVGMSREIIGKILPDARVKNPSGIWSEKDDESYFQLVKSLRESCHLIWGYMYHNIEVMTHDCTPLLKDKDLMDLMNILGHCSFRETNPFVFEPHYANPKSKYSLIYDKLSGVFAKLALPYYPTAAPARILKEADCRRLS